jgi:hypothetical protein
MRVPKWAGAIPPVLILLASLEAGALKTGELLVLDGQNNRVLAVDPSNGAVDVFSPNGGTNLLNTQPRSIAVDPATGEIVVLNGNTPSFVLIDPVSGRQAGLQEYSQGSLTLGPDPTGLAMSPRAPGFGSYRTLFVSEQGEVHEVERNLLGGTATLLASYPSQDEFEVGNFVVARDPGGGDPLDVFVETSDKVLVYDGSTMSEYWTIPQTTLQGLDYDAHSDDLYVSLRYDPTCPSSEPENNGVYFFALNGSLTPPQAGFGDLHPIVWAEGNTSCMGPFALDEYVAIPPFPAYFVDESTIPPKIIEIWEPPIGPNNYVVATLPEGSSATAIAIYTPEPDSGALAAAAAAALAALERARLRGSRRARTA